METQEENMSKQPQLFDTEDKHGEDIYIGPKIIKKELTFQEKIIDPKNPSTVGRNYSNLGNHTLLILFIATILFVIKASYG
jgi:hypothetical protein